MTLAVMETEVLPLSVLVLIGLFSVLKESKCGIGFQAITTTTANKPRARPGSQQL